MMENGQNSIEMTREMLKGLAQENPSASTIASNACADYVRNLGVMDDEHRVVFEELTSQQTPYHRALLIAALTISLTDYPDTNKLLILCHYMDDLDDEVSVRATVGMVISLSMYPTLKENAEIQSVLDRLHQNSDFVFYDDLCYIQHSLINTDNISSITHKINTELIPGMSSEDTREKSAKRLMKMIKGGVDMGLDNFRLLSKHLFFMRLGNWLAPFDMERHELKRLKEIENVAKVLIMGNHCCDADRYGMAIMLCDMMAHKTNIHAQIPDEIANRAEGLVISNLSREDRITYYIQNLYRLFTLSPWHEKLNNPFAKITYLVDNELFKDYFRHEDIVNFSRMLIFYKKYTHAIDLLSSIPFDSHNTEENYLLGHSYLNAGYLQMAKALLMDVVSKEPDNVKYIRNMAQCLEAMDDYENLLPLLERLNELQPDNVRVILKMAQTLTSLGRWEEALNKFFKLEFEEKELHDVSRGIAWCSFMLGRYDRAGKYYQKLLSWEDDVVWEDYLYAGHCSWITSNFNEAISRYRTYRNMYQDETGQDDNKPFLEDEEILLSKGISPEDFQRMADAIMM